MGCCAVAQGKSLSPRNPLFRFLASDNFCGEKEVLDLFLGKSIVVRGSYEGWENQTDRCSNESEAAHILWEETSLPDEMRSLPVVFVAVPMKTEGSSLKRPNTEDTIVAWLTFNDCITGRGYLLKLPFPKNGVIGKYTGALNSFDPKFSVAPDLRAYTDRGSIFVINIQTGKEAAMTFKETYENMDFNISIFFYHPFREIEDIQFFLKQFMYGYLFIFITDCFLLVDTNKCGNRFND